ncbi:MAG: cytochrome P450 [Burkholderiaceae bacterium]
MVTPRRAQARAGDAGPPDPPSGDGATAVLHLLADPYRYVSAQCRRLDSDLFTARLALEPAVFMSGADAAACFYDASRFRREGAAPEALLATLFGRGGVQGLDGERHRQRKALFVELTSGERVDALAHRFRLALRTAMRELPADTPVSLTATVQQVLMRVVCDWCGLPLAEGEREARTRDIVALFDLAGAKGLGHLRARVARRRADRWAARLIGQARARPREHPDSALEKVAHWNDADGGLLAPHVAAVELLNLVRPCVAVSVFITFAAHALATHRERADALRSELGQVGDPRDSTALTAFVQEVRRDYPFFPMLAARARGDIECLGHRIPADRLVLFDVYGTNHDPRSWSQPFEFAPERFTPDAHGRFVEPLSDPDFAFIPQGGGDLAAGHRCPGEGIALALMAQAVHVLCLDADYRVPEQDLGLDMTRLPALPRDGMRVLRAKTSG